MKKTLLYTLIFSLLLTPLSPTVAQSPSQARQEWVKAQEARFDTESIHKEAKEAYQSDKSPENEERFVDTAKDVMYAVLDEVEAWLDWKAVEAQASDAPERIKNTISSDVEKNKGKVNTLRSDVDTIENPLGVGLVFIKMVGNYLELLTDVARNSGSLWVHLGNRMLDTAEGYEERLRNVAESITDNVDIISQLDDAKTNLDDARSNVQNAESAYAEVVTPGAPLRKFGEGNQYLRTAKSQLRNAQSQMVEALELLLKNK